jgi:hypothetical protein
MITTIFQLLQINLPNITFGTVSLKARSLAADIVKRFNWTATVEIEAAGFGLRSRQTQRHNKNVEQSNWETRISVAKKSIAA